MMRESGRAREEAAVLVSGIGREKEGDTAPLSKAERREGPLSRAG